VSHPAADALTPSAMVVLQERPVVPFTTWLAEGLRLCSETGRGLQVVTPPESRITMPLRLVLTGPNSRWVVRADGGYYDGLTGVPLLWDGAAFTPDPRARAYAPSYTAPPVDPVGAHLTVTFRVRHAPGNAIGGAADQLCRALTGAPPGGWGTSEPATTVWRLADLGEMFGSRVSSAVWLTLVGAESGDRPAVGTMLLTQVGDAAEEAVTLVVGHADPREAPIGSLPTIVGALAAEFPLVSCFVQLSPGLTDLTTGPRWVGPAAPVGLAVSGSAPGPSGVPAQPIGDTRSPATWYSLGDGRQQEAWQRYELLTGHLRAQAS
jgi:Family of unknown function (DUF6177)